MSIVKRCGFLALCTLLISLALLAQAQTVTPVVYMAATVYEVDATRVLGSETHHVYLERIVVNGITYNRLRMLYQRSSGPGAGVGGIWSSFTATGFKTLTKRSDGFVLAARTNVYSTNDTITLDVRKVGALWSILYTVRDASGKVRYSRATGTNIRVMDISIQGLTIGTNIPISCNQGGENVRSCVCRLPGSEVHMDGRLLGRQGIVVLREQREPG